VRIFVDTSAFLPFLNPNDDDHRAAREAWEDAVARERLLTTTNYIVTETVAVLQRRVGLDAVQGFLTEVVPALDLAWVDEAVHEAGVRRLLDEGRRGLSLVDCTSFIVMRRLGIGHALTFDRHFTERGFECLP
jgi:predicted nucleic acid-binding protein